MTHHTDELRHCDTGGAMFAGTPAGPGKRHVAQQDSLSARMGRGEHGQKEPLRGRPSILEGQPYASGRRRDRGV